MDDGDLGAKQAGADVIRDLEEVESFSSFSS